MSRNAEREAYNLVPETCPKVDKALSLAEELIKEQTGKLRDALIEQIDYRFEAEALVEDLTIELDDLKDEISKLKAYIADLEKLDV